MISVGVGRMTAPVTDPDQFDPGTIWAVKLIGPFEFAVETSIPVLINWFATSCWPEAKSWSTTPVASLDVRTKLFSGERFSGALTVRVTVTGSQLSMAGWPPDPVQVPALLNTMSSVTTPG